MHSARELLEYAAKAAGYTVHGWIGERFYVRDFNHAYDHDPRDWNPLEDNAHAFDLAVRLRMVVNITERRVYAGDGDGYGYGVTETVDSNVHEATRRVIVMAAAEIGRSMS